MEPPKITSFLIKVASRCNLDCDYCYMYHHADQSWRSMPKLLSNDLQKHFIKRLSEYIQEVGIENCSIIFHGGEPLLAGAGVLAQFANEIRASTSAKIDISLQTNGLLLNETTLDILESADIGVSLSLDGPRFANDKHRLTKRGKSSFTQVEHALIQLQKRPKIFTGIIAVIDVTTSPEDLFQYFSEFNNIPQLDFLLPDAHHLNLPPRRDEDPHIYEKWLIKAFDIWLDHYSDLSIRTFESLLDVLAGLPSRTDAFGFGDISLLSIETDGSYHDLDVLKVTKEGATKLFGSVIDASISEVLKSDRITSHRNHLTKNGLSEKCQSCSIVEVCGGGSLPHRFGDNDFKNPTVYCGEIFTLVSHISSRLKEHLTTTNTDIPVTNIKFDIDFKLFEYAESAIDLIEMLSNEADKIVCSSFLSIVEQFTTFEDKILLSKIRALPYVKFKNLATHPGAIAWVQVYTAQNQGKSICSVDGIAIHADTKYLDYLIEKFDDDISGFRLAEADPWLRIPFGNAILFDDKNTIGHGVDSIVREALDIIENWRPGLALEMRKISRAIQFIRDPSADPNKIVSFSDNSVPGALYVSVVHGEKYIDPYDLADSLIHEHRHQKLYLLEQQISMVHRTSVLVTSPWREDPRPQSGLLHAVFVFVELRRFWLYVLEHGPERVYKRALNQIKDTDINLNQAFITLNECSLTMDGRKLVNALKSAVKDCNVYE